MQHLGNNPTVLKLNLIKKLVYKNTSIDLSMSKISPN